MPLLLKKVQKSLQYRWLLIFLLSMTLIGIYKASISYGTLRIDKIIAFPIFNVLTVLLLLYLISKISNVFIRYSIGILFGLINSINIIALFTFGDLLVSENFAVIYESHGNEVYDFITFYGVKAITTFAIYIVLQMFAISDIRQLSLHYQSFNINLKINKERNLFHLKIKYSHLLFFIVFIYWALFFRYSVSATHLLIEQSNRQDHKLSVYISKIMQLESNFFVKNILLISETFSRRSEITQYTNEERLNPILKYYNKANEKNRPTKIIFIIGESAVRDRHSIYGYPIETTPYLNTLAKQSFFYQIDNAISPSPTTTMSLRNTLSFSYPRNQSLFNQYSNVIELAKDAGYETVWISNNGYTSHHDTLPSAIGKTSDISDFHNSGSMYDIELINKLEKYYNDNKPQFIVLHLRGSHIQYEGRFDEIDRASNIKDSYDLTIHHTDRLFNLLHQHTLKQDHPTLIYYFSDHGEIPHVGHGFITQGPQVFEIPLFTIQHKLNYNMKEIFNKYQNPQLDIWNNINTLYVIAELMGYEIPNEMIQTGKDESPYIYHANHQYYLFDDIRKKNLD